MKKYSFLDGSTIEVSDDTCRGCFLEKMKNIPQELDIIWENENFCIRQDAECPVPGFYIVSTRKHINTIGDLTVEQSSQLGIIINRTRDIMRQYLNIFRVHIIIEEKMIEPHLHIWLLPLWKEIMEKNKIDPKIWNSNILEYIKMFSYEDNKDKICGYNIIMRKRLKDDEILSRFVR